jgi:hypothetical protein
MHIKRDSTTTDSSHIMFLTTAIDSYDFFVASFYFRRWAEQVFEDIYIAIYKTDGYDSAMRLRSRITETNDEGNRLGQSPRCKYHMTTNKEQQAEAQHLTNVYSFLLTGYDQRLLLAT